METRKQFGVDIQYLLVLTVPMRNGNTPSSLILAGSTFVLTVPMRNGNFFSAHRTLRPFLLVLTVPMRNGNYGGNG